MLELVIEQVSLGFTSKLPFIDNFLLILYE